MTTTRNHSRPKGRPKPRTIPFGRTSHPRTARSERLRTRTHGKQRRSGTAAGPSISRPSRPEHGGRTRRRPRPGALHREPPQRPPRRGRPDHPPPRTEQPTIHPAELTDAGRAILDELVALRIRAFGEVADQMSNQDRAALIQGAHAFTAAQQRLSDKSSQQRTESAKPATSPERRLQLGHCACGSAANDHGRRVHQLGMPHGEPIVRHRLLDRTADLAEPGNQPRLSRSGRLPARGRRGVVRSGHASGPGRSRGV